MYSCIITLPKIILLLSWWDPRAASLACCDKSWWSGEIEPARRIVNNDRVQRSPETLALVGNPMGLLCWYCGNEASLAPEFLMRSFLRAQLLIIVNEDGRRGGWKRQNGSDD